MLIGNKLFGCQVNKSDIKNLDFVKIIIVLTVILLGFSFQETHAQLGFCSGNSGDPIFTEDFETGIVNGPQLSPLTTTYTYTSTYPYDGEYTVSNGTFGNVFDWHEIEDHTSNDVNGKCLIVNAATAPGEFYNTTILGLCAETTYEFSAWLINLVEAGTFCSSQPGGTIPVNVTFEIWDISETILLKSGDTDDIIERTNPNWQEYGLVFKTSTGQNSVVLKMINNGIGGCGNDLAIDDIEFKTCGDDVAVADESNNSAISICSGQTPYTTTLTAAPDNLVFSTHFYQWQESTDGNIWTDIAGGTDQSITITSINTSIFYRTLVAEIASNLVNPLCIVISDIFQVTVTGSAAPNIACWETATLNAANCTWDISGMQPIQPNIECYETATFNNTSCSWNITGTQPTQPAINCWETATFNTATCEWDITGTKPGTLIEDYLVLCDGNNLKLQAQTTILNPSYVWSTGAITEEIIVDTLGVYTVDITNDLCSFETIIYNVISPEAPIIESVVSNGIDIIITTANSGDFLYSLDGIIFQSNNIFYDVEGGLYTIYVKNRDCDTTINIQHLHFYIPKFFTPNNDGINDTFNLSGIENYGGTQVAIFDRYGKLLKFSRNVSFEWDGTYNSQNMPSGDYWYRIILKEQQFSGHFALKR